MAMILFLAPDNIANIVRAVSETGIIAVGMTFVIITAGIDLSVGALLSLCSVLTATIMTTAAGASSRRVLFVVLCGAAFGAVQGVDLQPLPARAVHRDAGRASGRARSGAGHLEQPVHQHLLRRRAGPRAAGLRHSRRPALQQRRAGGDAGLRRCRGDRDLRPQLHPLRPLRVRRRRQRARGAPVRRAGVAGEDLGLRHHRPRLGDRRHRARRTVQLRQRQRRHRLRAAPRSPRS